MLVKPRTTREVAVQPLACRANMIGQCYRACMNHVCRANMIGQCYKACMNHVYRANMIGQCYRACQKIESQPEALPKKPRTTREAAVQPWACPLASCELVRAAAMLQSMLLRPPCTSKHDWTMLQSLPEYRVYRESSCIQRVGPGGLWSRGRRC